MPDPQDSLNEEHAEAGREQKNPEGEGRGIRGSGALEADPQSPRQETNGSLGAEVHYLPLTSSSYLS